MSDDQKRLDEAAARTFEAQVAGLAEKLFVSWAVNSTPSAYRAFQWAEVFIQMKENRWNKVAR